MATSASAIFTGNSQFATDLASSVTRAVKIASMPIDQLNTDLTALNAQTSALSGLDSQFAALQSAVQAIDDAVGGTSYQATVSDPSILSASAGAGAVPGTYSVDVVDIGAYGTSMSTAAWDGTAGTPHDFQLSIGTDDPIPLSPADNSAASMAAEINAKAGDKVRATVINVGRSGTPDYRVSLQSVALGNIGMDILDSGNSLQTQQIPPGREAEYIVNGFSQSTFSDSRTVSISDGLTVNLQASDDSKPVSITVGRPASALTNALSAFANAYNSVVTALDQQHGATQGALNGQSLVGFLGQALSGLSTYSPADGTISGLKSLGFDLGQDGKLTFTASDFNTANTADPAGVAAFLGSATGSGFLKAATDALAGVEDPDTGILKNAETDVKTQITNTNNSIADKQAYVDDLNLRLNAQMAAADAAISAMEQQYSYMSAVFQAMTTAAQQYK
jgi:flagellar hook-associated protein 2